MEAGSSNEEEVLKPEPISRSLNVDTMTGDFKRYSFSKALIFSFLFSVIGIGLLFTIILSPIGILMILWGILFLFLYRKMLYGECPHCSNNMTFLEKQKRLCKKCKTVVEVNII